MTDDVKRADVETTGSAAIPALAGRGPWVIISGDTRIFRSRHLREVWQQAKLTTFDNDEYEMIGAAGYSEP